MANLHDAQSLEEVLCLLGNGESVHHPKVSPLPWKSCEATRVLIEHGIDVNHVDDERMTPLFHVEGGACRHVVEMLVKAGADINHRDIHNRTPLLATRFENYAKYLIENGADVRVKDSGGNTPLYRAAMSDHPGVMAMILSKMETNEKYNDLSETLQQVVRKMNCVVSDMDVTSNLIWSGADVCVVNNDGNSAINLCNSSVLNLENILMAGGDPNHIGYLGRTPLHSAWSIGVVDTLVSYGADVNSQDSGGWTPLMNAVLRIAGAYEGAYQYEKYPFGYLPGALDIEDIVDICRRLIDYGSSTRIRSKQGSTVLDLVKIVYPPILSLFHDAVKEDNWNERKDMVLLRELMFKKSDTMGLWHTLGEIMSPGDSASLSHGMLKNVVGLDQGVFRNIVSFL